MNFTKDWRAMNDIEHAKFTEDKLKVRNGETIDIKSYGNKECRKSLAWTNATRNAINLKWMTKEAKENKHIIVRNFKIFKSLPLIANKTVSITTFNDKNNKYEVKNNEEFEVIDFSKEYIHIKNSRLAFQMKHDSLKYFDLAYVLLFTRLKAQPLILNFQFMNINDLIKSFYILLCLVPLKNLLLILFLTTPPLKKDLFIRLLTI